MTTVDYPRLKYTYRQHHERYVRRVQQSGLLCQDCGGDGQYLAEYIAACPRYEVCDWCEGTGRLTPWLRGQWLKYKRVMAG